MILTDRALIDQFSEAGIWGKSTLLEFFRNAVLRSPEKLAIADPPNRTAVAGGMERRLTYAQLATAAGNLAQAFKSLQLAKEDVIAFQLPNTVEQVVVLLAAFECGLIASPLPLLWREHELKTALPLIGPKALITSANITGRNHAEIICEVAVEVQTVRAVLAFGPDAPDGVVPLDAVFSDQDGHPEEGYETSDLRDASTLPDANDVATICWAGGDTVCPCPVPRSHNQWIAAGMMHLLEADIDRRSVMLSPYPMTGLVSIGAFFVPWLMSGATLCLHHPFDLSAFVTQLRSEGVTLTALPPAVIDLLKAEGAFETDGAAVGLRTLACVWPGPLIPEDAEERAADLIMPVIDIRALGEMAYVAKRRVAGEHPGLLEHGGIAFPTHKPGGAILLQTRVKGGVSSNTQVTSLLSGELMIKSPMMFDIYFPAAIDGVDAPVMSRDAQGFANTGLRCLITGAATPKIDIKQRNSNVIFYGGLSISAFELDQLYTEYPAISDAAAFAFDDPVMGERILAAVVPNPGETIAFDEFVAYLHQRKVAPYKVPDRLVTVKTIPRDQEGGVLRENVLEQI